MNSTAKLFISSFRSVPSFPIKNNRRSFSHVLLLRRSPCTQFAWSKSTRPLHAATFRDFHSTSLRSEVSVPAAKKRSLRKKRSEENLNADKFNVFAYATAEEFDLEALHDALQKQNLYETRKFFTSADSDVLHVRAKYKIDVEPHDIFFFREGSVVLWNCNELETTNVLTNLKSFEISSYDQKLVMDEKELMNYNYVNGGGQKAALKNGDFLVSRDDEGVLEKYTFSNAMTSSVKLGIWESLLDKYIDSLEFVTEDLKEGRKIKMSRAVALQKTGELFALKHTINLSSNLLETPDFYWDRDQLEVLFLDTCAYFAVQKRKRVNTKI